MRAIESARSKNARNLSRFFNESGYRSLHVVDVEATKKAIKLKDNGGTLGGKEEVSGEEVKFRIQDNALVAYLDISFRRGFESSAIKSITIGAKNQNWPANVIYFTGSLGYEDIQLRKSLSTYR